MKTIGVCILLVALGLAALPTLAPAQPCYGRGGGYGGGHYSPYYVYPYAVPIAISPDFYYSVSNYYRDKLLVDAFAGRVQQLLAQGAGGQVTPQAGPGYNPRVMQRTAQSSASAKLAPVVARSCLKCHSGGSAKAGLVLDDLDAVPQVTRYKCWRMVHKGAMPQGGTPLADAESELFGQWADSARSN